jgi:type I restriction enzyme S subunit
MTVSELSWRICKLEDCVEKLIDYRGKSPKKSEGGIPVLSAKVVKKGRILTPIIQTISPDYYSEWMRRGIPKLGDVVLTTEGPLGEVAQIDEKTYALGQRIVTLRGVPDRLDNTFLKFLLMSPGVQSELYARATGTTVLGISQKSLRKVPLRLPPYDEQIAIASVLGALDDKVENNNQMNETLEQLAQAIFKSWFVDFDPVRAKAAGNAPAHMDADTAELFPSSFGDDGLPAGWVWRKLGDCVSLTKGRSYKSIELQESDTALVSLKSFLRGGGYRSDGLKAYTGTYKDEQTLTSGDLIVALTDVTQAADVIGKPAIVRSNNEFKTLVASLDVGIIRSIETSVSTPFLYCMMMTYDFQSHIYRYTSGTTVLHLGKKGVPAYEFGMPTCEVLDKFTAIAKPIFSKIELNAVNSNTLVELRDTLLPKLMSGEIRVSDAEREVETAV